MRLLAALIIGTFACKSAPPRAPEVMPNPPVSPFAVLVAELRTPAQPVWPTLPAELAIELQKTAGVPSLGGARMRLESWQLDLSAQRPEDIGADIKAAFEGIYLAEPLAYRTPATD